MQVCNKHLRLTLLLIMHLSIEDAEFSVLLLKLLKSLQHSLVLAFQENNSLAFVTLLLQLSL